MDISAQHGRGWMAVAALTVVAAGGWWLADTTSRTVGLSLAGALRAGGAAGDTAPTGCTQLQPSSAGGSARDGPASANHTWHSLEMVVPAAARRPRGRRAAAGQFPTKYALMDTAGGSAALWIRPAPHRPRMLQWDADLGVDALILASGHHRVVRRFGRERYTGRVPIVSAEGIDKITFCYDFELTVIKDANPALTMVYDWSIDQSVAPTRWRMSPGDEATSTYRISATRDAGTPQNWRVTGTITIDNLTPVDAVLTDVTERAGSTADGRVDCGVELPGYVLAAGATLTCRYAMAVPDGAAERTTTRVSTTGAVAGGKSSASIDFDQAVVDPVDADITLRDSSGHVWAFHASGRRRYQKTFRCSEDAGIHPTTVRIVGRNTQASTAVSIDCRY